MNAVSGGDTGEDISSRGGAARLNDDENEQDDNNEDGNNRDEASPRVRFNLRPASATGRNQTSS